MEPSLAKSSDNDKGSTVASKKKKDRLVDIFITAFMIGLTIYYVSFLISLGWHDGER